MTYLDLAVELKAIDSDLTFAFEQNSCRQFLLFFKFLFLVFFKLYNNLETSNALARENGNARS